MSQWPNKLLASLDRDDYQRVSRALHTLRLRSGSALPHCGLTRVYFPGPAVCSILSSPATGVPIEVATIGNEGVVGSPSVGAPMPSPHQYLQIGDGAVQYMALPVFQAMCDNSKLGAAVAQYCGVFVRQVVQLASCNLLHPLPARCARWILMTHERLGHAQFPIPEQLLANIMGVPLASLEPVVQELVDGGTIKRDR